MISLIFYFDYAAEKIQAMQPKSKKYSAFISVAYLGATGYAVLKGPLYRLENMTEVHLFFLNSLWVMSLLISYSSGMIKLIRASEAELRRAAQIDQLTQICNRHFLIEKLEENEKKSFENWWLAMLDIDFFKKINDTYGHNAGDEVLKVLAQIISDECSSCIFARWGGEEFIIASNGENDARTILETLRKRAEETIVSYCENNIHFSITIGVSKYKKGQTIDGWIQSADDLLYEGKKNGKNKLVMEED